MSHHTKLACLFSKIILRNIKPEVHFLQKAYLPERLFLMKQLLQKLCVRYYERKKSFPKHVKISKTRFLV